ncbi:N-acetylmuramoyl-L-alanine amidase, partial [Francisella tularensis subsp. holarctica]|uniref:N-acetylmuramoyl-L-alanine amidase n=1 Tax=Francisella tularensis TaxID=263 RepID=UPI002381A274
QRADKNDINQVVIHCISFPEVGSANCNVEKFFTNQLDCSLNPSFASLKGVEVSAQFNIKLDCENVQFVSVDDRAWHAGV